MECRPAEKAIETILARGYLSRIAVSASDCLSLDNPHFFLPRPPTSLNHRQNRTLLDLGSMKTSISGSVQFHPSTPSPSPSLDQRTIDAARCIDRSFSLSLSPPINMRRTRSQTIGRRSPIPYLSPLLDLMAADNWLQVGPGSSIRGVHAWNPRTIEFHSAVAPTFRKIGTDFLR